MGARSEVGAFAQVAKGPYIAALFHDGLFHHRHLDAASIADGRIADDRAGADGTCLSDPGLALEEGVGPDNRASADFDVGFDIGCFGVEDGHARSHPALVDAPSHLGACLGELDLIVQCRGFQGMENSQGRHGLCLLAGGCCQVRQEAASALCTLVWVQIGPEPIIAKDDHARQATTGLQVPCPSRSSQPFLM